jgi:hypothetical protein
MRKKNDPDPGGPKTCGSCRSGSACGSPTLVRTAVNFVKSIRELTELTEENSEVDELTADEIWSTSNMGDETTTESVRLVPYFTYGTVIVSFIYTVIRFMSG